MILGESPRPSGKRVKTVLPLAVILPHSRVVRTHPTGQSQPIGNIPFERSIECITLHIILEQLSIGNPIRIFHAINEFQTPKLFAGTRQKL